MKTTSIETELKPAKITITFEDGSVKEYDKCVGLLGNQATPDKTATAIFNVNPIELATYMLFLSKQAATLLDD